MSLSQGDHLGRFEILDPIGAGGMGEVWRARDTELGREVAIKVLPEAVASEPRRVERFRREARALAALRSVAQHLGMNAPETELKDIVERHSFQARTGHAIPSGRTESSGNGSANDCGSSVMRPKSAPS